MDIDKLNKILAGVAAEHKGLDLKIREDGYLEARYMLNEVGVHVEFTPEPAMRAFGVSFAYVSYETPPSVVDADPHHLRDIASQLDWLLLRVETAFAQAHAEYHAKAEQSPEPRAHASDREVVHRKRILCADGFSISVQASSYHYSEPRDNRFADIRLYELVEGGYPEGPDGCEHEVPQWFEDFRECGDSKVFPYVPIMQVMKLIDAHGGRVEGGEIVTDY